MLSASDIKKLIEVFATKEDLNNLKEEFVTKSEFHETMNDVIDKLDAVHGEVKDMRQEQSAHHQIHEDIQEEITTIKSRLDKVESAI